ncbi:adenylate/guanylate cyclase domain-containing protein [Tropicimonas sp. TH_r6]|uniref:adenylate/guanylate cyclase domain-containing protein n=1 Tax=Tropicimonas sp. TH_r6 TaxID=3082085 RepID=UPI0029532FE7|nr:adenylate/guanylate cyclase domain-containing protein [Tropicimonas sp. TH_r6]MDV7143951.1 adenylate/guanylate cyclase domain-containing protein [Tropicimonas sp. TH_r6]
MRGLLAGFAPVPIILGASWGAFRHSGILVDASFPLLGGAMNFGLLLACRFLVLDRDRCRIRRSFSYYAVPRIAPPDRGGGHRLELGGCKRGVTVLFSDIRDSKPLSETLAPQALVALLNEPFTRQGGEILARHGTIDKFIGDAIMAF